METINSEIFYKLNQRLIAKAIEELQFEEILQPEQLDTQTFRLRVSDELEYRFRAQFGVWNNVWIQAESLSKYIQGVQAEPFFAFDFFTELQTSTQMSDETLSIFLEEMQQTLYCDYQHWSKTKHLTSSELASLEFEKIDRLLPGHPKLLLNKGRMGWGAQELERYAPESQKAFQLYWLAIRKNRLVLGIAEDLNNQGLLEQSLLSTERARIEQKLLASGALLEDFFIFPVHPWQWQRYLKIQYQHMIYTQDLIMLGECGDYYHPQVSLRTLSNRNQTKNFDLKLSLSILNTSCVRGIPGKYIEVGHRLSRKLKKMIDGDDFLTKLNLKLLQEKAAVHCPLISYQSIKAAPYRFNEMLGCVWRESVQSVLSKEEMAIPTAALFYRHGENYLIADYIKKSGLSAAQWIKFYFEHVVLPLYHLQLKYGLGLVAHGQNTILILKGFVPAGMIAKDFHGDLRVAQDSPLIGDEVFEAIDKLPSEYLIHDLITGHLVTVLRYFSRAVAEACDFAERYFYQILGMTIDKYLLEHANTQTMNEKINLLRPCFEKLLVNKVRFVAGYSETPVRLKPMLGQDIANPIFLSMQHE